MNSTTHQIEVQPVIMAGGSGTRLWPLSRAGYPKQFLAVTGSESLFQQATTRLLSLANDRLSVSRPVVVCNEDHRFLVLDQLHAAGITADHVILEPVGRNTAPAVTLAALQILRSGSDPVMVVAAADQTVANTAAFTASVRRAVLAAADGAVTILGVVPEAPETGYGYIRAEQGRVVQFVEKPDASTAAAYLEQGCYYWNAGMFVLRASTWISALEQFRPDIALACRESFGAGTAVDMFVRPDAATFANVPAESVDYAVMERCPGTLDIRMEPLAAGWNDLGAWDAAWQVAAKDAQGNVAVGDTILAESQNSLVHASSRLVAVVGANDVIVVETSDAVLVADKSRSQHVKHVVARLGQQHRTEHLLHRKVHRPWGWYDSLDHGPRHQVKRIMVKPGAALSLQLHHHRSEHWVVVAGTAEVTVGEQTSVLTENQSVYIPVGAKHRLRNPADTPLEIIEVQSGSYLGEDDIVRFEDTYGRA